MSARIRPNRSAQPSRLTIADRNRQAIALREYDKRASHKRAMDRLLKLASMAALIAVSVAAFYALSDAPDSWNLVQLTPTDAYVIDHGLTLGDCVERLAPNIECKRN